VPEAIFSHMAQNQNSLSPRGTFIVFTIYDAPWVGWTNIEFYIK
jgi:hypothetical protein